VSVLASRRERPDIGAVLRRPELDFEHQTPRIAVGRRTRSPNRHPTGFCTKMVDVRGSVDERSTSPQSQAATGTDVRVAARALESTGAGPTVARRRAWTQVVVGGGLLVAVLVALAASVVRVSVDSKHPLVQPVPTSPTTSPPTSTVTAGPIPLPATTAQQAPPVDTPTAPAEAWSPSQVTAETMSPAPPPMPRLPTLHELFPQLFPSE
jgi:hypothetical protein